MAAEPAAPRGVVRDARREQRPEPLASGRTPAGGTARGRRRRRAPPAARGPGATRRTARPCASSCPTACVVSRIVTPRGGHAEGRGVAVERALAGRPGRARGTTPRGSAPSGGASRATRSTSSSSPSSPPTRDTRLAARAVPAPATTRTRCGIAAVRDDPAVVQGGARSSSRVRGSRPGGRGAGGPTARAPRGTGRRAASGLGPAAPRGGRHGHHHAALRVDRHAQARGARRAAERVGEVAAREAGDGGGLGCALRSVRLGMGQSIGCGVTAGARRAMYG